MKISVIGCGYLGTVHAACMTELGHEVVGTKAILDGRNCLDPVVWRNAGWSYRALGRP